MTELKELKDGEAEILIRTKEKVLRLELPKELVDELEDLKEDLEADDILEALVKSGQTMFQMFSSMDKLKGKEYKKEDEQGREHRISQQDK